MLPADKVVTNRLINGAENHYCGYCSKLVENINDLSNSDDNNVIFCASCQGLFHLQCTALSSSPNKQTLTWKCNSCVEKDAELPILAITPVVGNNEPINYDEEQLQKLVEQRLLSLRHRFANDLQIVSARFTSTAYNDVDKDECLVINDIPRVQSEKLIELVCKLSTGMGVRLTPQRILRCGLGDDQPTCSFVIKFDSQSTRQFVLNNYLNSIMRPIVMPKNNWQVGGSDSEATSTTCLLPQQSTSGNNPIYMFEYLSPHNQTLFVKSVNSLDPQQIPYSQPQTRVVHDDSSNVNIVPVIKISSAPLIRLASKESFDDFEGKKRDS